jgi:hypothetical protein
MENEQKERLEQELRFLQESLDADVISRDEYAKGKLRIEKKLQELEAQEELPTEEIEIKEIKEKPTKIIGADFEEKDGLTKSYEGSPEDETEKESEAYEPEDEVQPAEYESEPSSETFVKREETLKEVRQREDFEQEPGEKEPEEVEAPAPEKSPPEPEEESQEATVEEKNPLAEEPIKEEEQLEQEEKPQTEEKSPLALDEEPVRKEPEAGVEEKQSPMQKPVLEEDKEERVTSKKWIYGIAIVIIAVILFFMVRGCQNSSETLPAQGSEQTPVCLSDSDCQEQGAVGICLNPGEQNASCEFKRDTRTALLIINDKDCQLCDPQTTENILTELFPNAALQEIDYKTTQGQKLIQDYGLNALPAYIFDSNVSTTMNFESFSTALKEVEGSYVLTNTAAASVFYFTRPESKNKLDYYVLAGDNQKIESAIKEVEDLFHGKIEITEHLVTGNETASLERELGINTYPSFLLNNQYVFRGILPANIIKERICAVDSFATECKKELSKI